MDEAIASARDVASRIEDANGALHAAIRKLDLRAPTACQCAAVVAAAARVSALAASVADMMAAPLAQWIKAEADDAYEIGKRDGRDGL